MHVEEADCCEYTLATVSTVLIVDDRFGMPGKPFSVAKSHVIVLLGTGRVEELEDSEDAYDGGGGRSLLTLLLVLAMLTLSLSFSSFSCRPPTIHQMPDGLLRTLTSSVLRVSISPASTRASAKHALAARTMTYIPCCASQP